MKREFVALVVGSLALACASAQAISLCNTCAYITGETAIFSWDPSANAFSTLPNTAGAFSTSAIDSLIFDANGNLIYDGTNTVYRYNFATETSSVLATFGSDLADIALEPSGQSVLVSSRGDGKIYRLNLNTNAVTVFYQQTGSQPQGVIYDNSGRLFAVLADQTQVAQLDPTTGAVLRSISVSGGDGITFSTTTLKLYVGSNNVGFYTIDTGLTQAAYTDLSASIGTLPKHTIDGVGTAGNFLYLIDWNNGGYQYNLGTHTLTNKTPTITDADDIAPLSGLGSVGGGGSGADVVVKQTANPASIPVGSNTTLTIVVTNNGPNPSTGTVLTETLPAELTFVSATTTLGSCGTSQPLTCNLGALASGAGVTITVVATGNTASSAATAVATATEQTPDPNTVNNTGRATVQITSGNSGGGASADVSISQTANPTSVQVGNQVALTMIVTNNGPDSSTGTVVTDTLSSQLSFVSATTTNGTCGTTLPLTCNIGTLGAAGSATITLVVKANTATPSQATANAGVTAQTPDPNMTNNSSGVAITITSATGGAEADLAVSQTSNPTSIAVGDGITFTIVVVNKGPQAASGVTIKEALPPSLSLISSSGNGLACDNNNPTTCTSPAILASGGQLVMTVTARATIATSGATVTATVSSAVSDPDLTNNTAPLTIVIRTNPNGSGNNPPGLQDLSQLKVYPIPYKSTDTKVSGVNFVGMPAGTQIQIYTVTGQKVWNATSLPDQPVVWPAVNDRGEKVASYVYFYRVTAGTNGQIKHGKLVVIQ